ncbi:hypothetical protein INS49_003914 [Diaporthe citri]|uniref:uncharacterized protein n=1 Tax=Diaporthe citri TaxID=83186 RepID=UPI001C824C62|nr:uncharacterized protein INS49_003914 [Diaporthe citri]KAG6354833.1 hypothetical protein INS49_003914 [Diaporthe citri]
MVKPPLSESWIAGESLLDTGFQILKAAACMESWNEYDISAEFAAELMCDWAPSWLLSMEKSEKRKKYDWPHAEKEGVNTFRLDEHVWIWRALKSLELKNRQAWDKMLDKSRKSQLAAQENEQEVSDGPSSGWEDEILRLRKTFRESRFILHGRDTALVYSEPFDFLVKGNSVQELWKITIQCQMYHTEYQHTNWRKTLRYALYIMLGARDLDMNGTQPAELVRTATDILIRSSSPNGFFPSRIEISTNEPVEASRIAEEDLGSYYHASFEIPYILLAHMEPVIAAYTRSKREVLKFRRHSDSMLGGNFPRTGSVPQSIGQLQGDAEKVLLRLLLSRSTISDLDNNEVFRDVRRTTKKAVPFDQLVDSSNIVKLDDEWL